MTEEEIKQFWVLYEKMNQENLLEKPEFKYCDYCKKLEKLPNKEENNSHWKWVKGSKSFRCVLKDVVVRKQGHLRLRNTIDGFLQRRYEVIRSRCTNSKNNRYHLCKDRLNIDYKDFIIWGKQSLDIFMKENNIEKPYGKGIQVDRINNSGKYELGNLQWILISDHMKKSKEEGVWKNNKIKIKYYEILREKNNEKNRV